MIINPKIKLYQKLVYLEKEAKNDESVKKGKRIEGTNIKA